MRSSASVTSAFATCSTIARRCVSKSSTSARRFCQSTKVRERAMALRRLRISRAASAGLCAPASSSRKRRFAAASPALISINNSARRSAPSASRFFALSVFFTATRRGSQKIPRPRPHASPKTSGNRVEAPSMAPVSR